ncbi:hypothetical protein [Streptomyces erythrochromogenes]|uniref:hypothetical protein n=1 Tax=Streptomyces erythrochromogenes TaxID=285574 RepID=UPI0036C93192
MAVKGTFIDEGPLVVGMRSAVPAGGAVLCVGAVVGVGALRLRRRAMVLRYRPRARCQELESQPTDLTTADSMR